MNTIYQTIRQRFGKWARLGAGAAGVVALSACDPSLISGGGNINNGDTVKVALLVPYGSSNAGDEALARSFENAARLALADIGDARINLTVYNTAGQAGNAAAAADRAAAEGAQIIVGPLRSDAANAAAIAARDDNLNVLAFSNNASIAGGNLFILGNTFDNISNRLMRYAGAQGRTRMVVVHPDTAVGRIAREAVVGATRGTNVSVVGEASFEFTQQGIVSSIPSIAATVQNSNANALMLTSDSTGALPLLTRLLPEQGVSPSVVKYMGLTRWDIPNQTLSLPGVQGGWFTLPDPTLSARFTSRYRNAYGAAPHPLAGLAYDGVAAVGALVAKNRDMSKANLTQKAGFVGVNGVFRLNANGTNERALAVAQAAGGTIRIIDPAPKSFGRGGF